MRDIEDITIAIINACKSSVELNTMVQELYSKPLTYMVGVNEERNEYDNDYADVPLVVIDPMAEAYGDEDENRDYHVGVKILIQHPKSEFDLYTQKVGQVIEYKGVFEVHRLYKLFYKALKASQELNCFNIKEVESLSSTIEFVSNNIEYWGQIKLVFSNTNEDNLIGGCSIGDN